MSFQSIPDVNTSVEFSREDSLNLLLASVAFEEFGLARLIDAEAEKIQHVLGNHHKGSSHPKPPVTFEQILDVNKAVDQVLRDIIKKEILLQLKLESVLAAHKQHKHHPHPCGDKCSDKECGC